MSSANEPPATPRVPYKGSWHGRGGFLTVILVAIAVLAILTLSMHFRKGGRDGVGPGDRMLEAPQAHIVGVEQRGGGLVVMESVPGVGVVPAAGQTAPAGDAGFLANSSP